ncbi:glycosyltransferase 87 family protein [Thermogemmatispora carboxidivorans]|uniref:glycosyltransferase 87 family protein n=1 Tax=Thermogemmatispora carboxidivorans TaxID=1382306 RepID=UPI00069BD5F2|nr:glycosyltransferase 87 family protein [Thermogemmatispora carboxidivorans]
MSNVRSSSGGLPAAETPLSALLGVTQGIRRGLERLANPTGGALSFLPLALALLVMLALSSWQMVWPTSDVTRYECYALAFWFGGQAHALAPQIDCSFLPAQVEKLPPLHTLPIEYPPLTLILFTPGLLVPTAYYPLVFGLLMALAALFIYWLLLRWGPRGAALAFTCYLFLGEWGLALLRFDLVPAALTLLCVLAAERRRWRAAYGALALAILLKIYPLLLLPPLFFAEQQAARAASSSGLQGAARTPLGISGWVMHALSWLRRCHWRNLLLCLALLLGTTGVFALLDFQGAVASQLAYFAQRPVQIESSGTLVIWLAALAGQTVHVVYTYGSINLLSPLVPAVSLGSTLALLAGYGLVLWQSARGRLAFAEAALAALLIFVATGKVFSPQYLIWLMPLVAYLTATQRRWLLWFGLIALQTSLIYPFLYTRVQDATQVWRVPGFLPLVELRNLLFLLLTIGYLFNLLGLRRRCEPRLAAQIEERAETIREAERYR